MSFPLFESADGLELEKEIKAIQAREAAPSVRSRWPQKIWQMLLSFLLMGLLIFGIFPLLWGPAAGIGLVLLGYLLWRHGWSIWSAYRGRRFCNVVWPDVRRRADLMWQQGWRPKRFHVQITACFEAPEITRRAIFALVQQIREEGIPTTVYYGTASAYDEAILTGFFEDARADGGALDLQLVFIRLKQSGHYITMGKVLREIRRWGAEPDDLILFLDDDTILGPDALRKTLPLFVLDPELQLVGTGQEAICFGPKWVRDWLRLRFARRHQELCSQSLSGRFLPLSGRLRILRARRVLDEAFIRQQEQSLRFPKVASKHLRLSVSDSITWIHLLRSKGRMMFVPDVTVYSISLLRQLNVLELALHLRRWSGQSMQRAIQVLSLGPAVISGYIWWRVLDMRLAFLMTLLVPAMLLVGEGLSGGVALTWIVVGVTARFLTGLYTLGREISGRSLLLHGLWLTPLIHICVSLLDWGHRAAEWLQDSDDVDSADIKILPAQSRARDRKD